MKTASVAEIKRTLKDTDHPDLVELCLRLARFKKENKELLTYLLYEADDEHGFIIGVKEEMDESFEEINTSSLYYIKKSLRKILRMTRKYIRYSKQKETEVELLLHFCERMRAFNVGKSTAMQNLYARQVHSMEKALSGLHEDLQYDYLENLKSIRTL